MPPAKKGKLADRSSEYLSEECSVAICLTAAGGSFPLIMEMFTAAFSSMDVDDVVENVQVLPEPPSFRDQDCTLNGVASGSRLCKALTTLSCKFWMYSVTRLRIDAMTRLGHSHVYFFQTRSCLNAGRALLILPLNHLQWNQR